MKYRMRNIFLLLSSAAFGFVPTESPACAPYFQPYYMQGKSPYPTVFRRKAAVRRLIAELRDLIPARPEIPDGVPMEAAVSQDFKAAVNQHLPRLSPEEKEKLVNDYLLFWQESRKKENMSMDSFPKLPEELLEFTLYHAGVAEMKADGREIPPSWKKLLKLPRRSRYFRTVWVCFMLGNYLKQDCGRYYQACRAAARAGFADTPGLLKASYKNEFRFTADPVRKIHLALEAQRNCPDLELLAEAYHSVNPKNDAECVSMLADPLCREVLAVFGCNRQIFQQEVWKYQFRNADILAWRAYEAGEVELAEKYLKLRTRDTLLSTYIEAKIARYHGNNELAIQKLRQWLKFVEKIDPNDRADIVGIKHVSDPWDTEPTYPLQQDIYGLLGSALVLRQDFAEAAMFFYRAGQIEADVMYIAENLMTLSELTSFTDSISGDLNSENQEKRQAAQSIRHMTARRAFREGRFDIARKYLPEQYKGILDQYLAFVQASKDVSKSFDSLALNLYNAARIMRWYGMELCGTQGAPDDFPAGNWGISADFEDCPDCKYDPETDRWTNICNKHQDDYGYEVARNNATQGYFSSLRKVPGFVRVPRNQRFHYRYLAAELASRAGDFAQDEDLRALANLFGGECLHHRTPRKADFFYKRMVRLSPNSPIARIADKLRWFPDCPVLKKELGSAVPYKSLDEVKTSLEKAVTELNEIMKKKTEEQRKRVQRKMFDAVKKNDLKVAESCLKSGVDVNAPDNKGLVPLHYAAACQHVEMIKWLLSHGADVNRKNQREWTPLHYALGCDEVTEKLCPKWNPAKRLEITMILVTAKADVNAEDDHGVRPVNLAIDSPEILEYLAEHGGILSGGNAFRGQTMLHWAINYDAPVKTVKLILKHGGRINEYDGDGYAPLHRAVQRKKLQIVKCLVEHGANITLVEEEEGKTALELAMENHQAEIVKYLKAHGAVSRKSLVP